MTHYALYLSQTQFFVSLGFMLLFLALELGLSWVLFYFRLRTFGKAHNAWMGAYRFWVRVFALAFIVSFAAAMPVLIQFGSLWPGLMEVMGEVAGPLLAFSMLSLFLFKSCFLGAMLFGQRFLSASAHTLMVFMVAVGVTISALSLLVLLAWMHVPTGVLLVDGHYQLLDWGAVLATPALPWYAALFFSSSVVVAACFLIGIVAAQTLRRPASESERLVLRTGSILAVLALCVQLGVVMNSAPVGHAQAVPRQLAEQTMRQPVEPVADLVVEEEPTDEEWQEAVNVTPLSSDEILHGAEPVLSLAAWSLRLAYAAGAGLLLLTAWSLFRLARFGFEPQTMSHYTRRLLVLSPAVSWLVLLAGAAYVFLGTTPFIIGDAILFTDVMARHGLLVLSLGAVGLTLVYVFCMYGFFGMIRHVVRFGVVPVARHRGRA